jgi:hypothetical protein
MTERYTKMVLTIVAAALVGLLAVQLTPVARSASRRLWFVWKPLLRHRHWHRVPDHSAGSAVNLKNDWRHLTAA